MVLICFWNPMLLCHVYGLLKSPTMTRGDWTGVLTAPEKIWSAATPLVGFVMKLARPSSAKLRSNRSASALSAATFHVDGSSAALAGTSWPRLDGTLAIVTRPAAWMYQSPVSCTCRYSPPILMSCLSLCQFRSYRALHVPPVWYCG